MPCSNDCVLSTCLEIKKIRLVVLIDVIRLFEDLHTIICNHSHRFYVDESSSKRFTTRVQSKTIGIQGLILSFGREAKSRVIAG